MFVQNVFRLFEPFRARVPSKFKKSAEITKLLGIKKPRILCSFRIRRRSFKKFLVNLFRKRLACKKESADVNWRRGKMLGWDCYCVLMTVKLVSSVYTVQISPIVTLLNQL
jgi:hypothetical protein